MPKVVPEYKKIAKEKITKAAYNVFTNKGYHKTTMDDIANEVGVSKASLYSYFKSKEEILQTVTKENLNLSFTDFFDNKDSLDSLEDLYKYLVEFEDVIHLTFEMTSLSSHNNEISIVNKNIYKKKLITLTNFIKSNQIKGNIQTNINASTLAHLLNAVYIDLCMQLIIGIDKTKIRESWNSSISVILEKDTHDNQRTLNKYFSNF
ncbi:TetR/AcrR family transcriptional regulator [Methanobacterium spitsbergense]|uniref:TetR/AcrR family transcriptional regulator n=1 Tax=Methanobacterium spitsbergense TaxID=2874285 RepID=A0A8T5V4C4_9EURY|nr:TetR/AcrR family transcriptional regulator [Methanobacterium spitsbergense]MBZ2166525.1 TetR/AcrR family transcriptional regulator [Methanobacterium spitsbergense]